VNTLSVTTTPPTQQRDTEADHGHDRNAAFSGLLEKNLISTCPLARAVRSVSSPKHVEYAGAGLRAISAM